jgi:hypothetical protein
MRREALRRATEWILRRQEADGSWGGIQPPWVYSMIALNLIGHGPDHPVMRAAFDGLDRFTIVEPERGPLASGARRISFVAVQTAPRPAGASQTTVDFPRSGSF